MPNTLDLGTLRDGAAPPDLQTVLPLQALQVAAGLSCWVAENAKSARALLKRVHAVVPLARPLQDITIRELPRPRKGAGDGAADPVLGADWLSPALGGQDMGLVSEAGLPAVADPGAALVRAAHLAGVPVRPLSGPSSLMLALAASGLNGQSFAFVGYLPTAPVERAQRLRELEGHSRRWQQTQLVIETPYRNTALLAGLREALQSGTLLSVACGVTLPSEAIRTADVLAWRQAASSKASEAVTGPRGLPVELPADIPAVFMFLAR